MARIRTIKPEFWTAEQIIELSAYRAAHPDKVVRLRLAYDPLWMWRAWLAWWGIK